MRTKQGLAAARAKGKKLGRPKGSRDKERVLDPYRDQILEYLEMGLTLAAVMKIITKGNRFQSPTANFLDKHRAEKVRPQEFR